VRKFGFVLTLAIVVALVAIVFSTISTFADSWPVCCYNLPTLP
jgi:hypothetical protein